MRPIVCLVLALALSCSAVAQEASDLAKPANVKGPLSPEESLKHLVLADPNLVIEIVAAEPEVIDPVAIQFDEHGRLWVVELSDYPNGPEPGKPPMSRIKLLEDKDGDGRYETAHIFADKLLFATGVQPWDGGVIVTLAGEVAYFKDTDGDHKADLRETWFTGFAQANPQLRANHPTFGPDGWIYVANGLRGGDVIAVKKDWPSSRDAHVRTNSSTGKKVGKKENENSNRSDVGVRATEPQPVSLTGRDFKFDPLTGRYEAISGNGQFGMTFDAWGNRFVCDNRHPCRHVIFEEDFIKRCPHVAFPAVVHDVIPADDKNRVFPLTSAWTTSNLHAGTFTAACGVTVYTGDWLPEEFRGNVFVCEPTGNLVQRAILEPDGVTFKSRNPYQRSDDRSSVVPRPRFRNAPSKPLDESTSTSQSTSLKESPSRNDGATQEFLASRDDWFRPVDLQNGPDGALYVVDMYRAVIEHPEWVPDELKKRPDTWLGNDKGRIYRIRPKNPRTPPRVAFAKFQSEPGASLGNDNGWFRITEARLLHERFARGINFQEMKEIRNHLPNDLSYCRSVVWNSPYLSRFLPVTSDEIVFNPSNSWANDRTRAAGLRRVTALAIDESVEPRIRERFKAIALRGALSAFGADPHDTLAFAHQAVQTWHIFAPSPTIKTSALAELAMELKSDSWSRQAITASAGDDAADLLSELVAVCNQTNSLNVQTSEFTDDLCALFATIGEQAGATSPPGDLLRAVALLCEVGKQMPSRGGDPRLIFSSQFDIATSGLLAMFKGNSRRTASERIQPRLFEEADAGNWGQFAATVNEVVLIPTTPDCPTQFDPSRLLAIRMLRYIDDERTTATLQKVVETSDVSSLRLAAVESFGSIHNSEVDAWLIERYRSETPAIRRAILAALFASKERQLRLLEAIEQGQIAATELGPVQANQLTQSKDETVRERAKTILAAAAPASRKEVLDAYQPALSLKGDPKRGRELFVKNCSTCHRVDNVGVNVAPDISDTRTKKPEQLLLDIVDPNKAIDANYFAYAVALKDGTVQSGVISAETATSITLKQPEGKVLTLLRSDIEELRNTGLSLMPVGLEKNVDQQAMADLIFWLKNWRYLDGKVPATSLK